MTEAPRPPGPPDVPEAVAAPKSGRSLQLVWLIPLVAALVGGWLAVKAILDKGPKITITFVTAEGLEAGKTKLKYKDVDVGLVTSVVLSRDTKRVVATAEIVKDAKDYLVEDTRFWVVRPRISGGTVTGLGTLLSGSYVGMDIGKSAKERRDFVGLEVPPIISAGTAGREFILHAANMGSLDVGSPVYFRRLQAGQVSGYALDEHGKGVTMKVFIDEPFDKFVTANTRFWQASGIDVTLDSSGIKVDTQSVVSILIGGLAFESPVEPVERPQAAAETKFTLFASRAEALKNPETDVMKQVLVFNESVRGLAPGAPVDFRGIEVGQVTAIKVDTDVAKKKINIVVEADLYPARLRSRAVVQGEALDDARRLAYIERMVANGLRAQLRTGNLLTGQLYVALDFFPGAARAKLRVDHSRLLEIPTVQSSLLELQASLGEIAKKLKDFPLDQIGEDLQGTLKGATKLIEKIDAQTVPELDAALSDARKALDSADQALKPNSPLSQDARDAMREIARAAAAFRALSDYLDRHPEALISGKREDPKEDNK